MKSIVEFIYEVALVELDPNLKVKVNYKTEPNTYTVLYIDKRGKEYEATVDEDNFEIYRYANEVVDIMSGTTKRIQKPWQDKLIKWVKQNSK